MDKAFLTVKDISVKLGVSEKTIYRMLTDNQIPLAVKIGGQWRFKADDIEEWVNSQKNNEPAARPRVDYRISLSTALENGAIFYRIHGLARDEIIDELLAALPYSSTIDVNALKVSIFSRESVVSSSLKGIAYLMTDASHPVFFERTMLLLGFLEKPADLKAIDRISTEAIFLVLPANRIEQEIIDMKLRRMSMDSDFVAAIRRQLTRKELLGLVRAREEAIFQQTGG